MHASLLVLMPAAASAWYLPAARYSYRQPVRYYSADPFWPSSFTSPWSHALARSSSFDSLNSLASRALSLHTRALSDEVFRDADRLLDQVFNGGWHEDENNVYSAVRVGSGLKDNELCAKLSPGGKQLTLSGTQAAGYNFESTISLPFSVDTAESLALEYSSTTGLVSVRMPKASARQPSAVAIATAPALSDEAESAAPADKQDHAGAQHGRGASPAVAPEERTQPQPRDEKAEQAMLEEKYAFVNEKRQAEAAPGVDESQSADASAA